MMTVRRRGAAFAVLPILIDTARPLARLGPTHLSHDGRMMEKYYVVDPARETGDGEYPTQDGFGWTNGVALALTVQARLAAMPVRAARRSAVRP